VARDRLEGITGKKAVDSDALNVKNLISAKNAGGKTASGTRRAVPGWELCRAG
jgi:hypothetical protein